MRSSDSREKLSGLDAARMSGRYAKKRSPLPSWGRGPWLRMVVPAFYCALLLMGSFRAGAEEPPRLWAILALALYAGYMALRFYRIYATREEQHDTRALGGITAVETGLMAVIALAAGPS